MNERLSQLSKLGERASGYIQTVSKNVNQHLDVKKHLNQLQELTGIPPTYILAAILLILFFLLGSVTSLLVYSVVVLYPAFQSFQCLETDDTEHAMKWLKYWIVFTVFHTVERVADTVLWWIPLYGLVKVTYQRVVFLSWCLAPIENNGSEVIYNTYIRPILQKNSDTVNKAIEIFRKTFNRVHEKVEEIQQQPPDSELQ